MSVTWTASTIGSSVAATSYTVERFDMSADDLGAGSCGSVPASSGTPNPFGSFSCTDTPSAGTYKYRITAHYSSAWTAATGYTNAVTVKNTTAISVAAPATDTSNTAIAKTSIGSTLSGAAGGATGTITFTVFGSRPSAPTSCISGGTQVGTAVTVSGNGTYHPRVSYTPTTAGTYWWYASYGGDASNNASTSTCGSGMTSTLAWSASPAANVTTQTLLSTSATTSSFTVQPSTTYLLFVFRRSGSGDSIASISSTGLSPVLTSSSFTAITSQNFNTRDYQCTYYVTTASNVSGTGTLSVSFINSLPAGGATILDLVQIAGNTRAPRS